MVPKIKMEYKVLLKMKEYIHIKLKKSSVTSKYSENKKRFSLGESTLCFHWRERE